MKWTAIYVGATYGSGSDRLKLFAIKLVGVARFELAIYRLRTEDVDQATLHPEIDVAIVITDKA